MLFQILIILLVGYASAGSSTSGACCGTGNSCTIRNETACAGADGGYAGDGTVCPDACSLVKPCCLSTQEQVCEELTCFECHERGGTVVNECEWDCVPLPCEKRVPPHCGSDACEVGNGHPHAKRSVLEDEGSSDDADHRIHKREVPPPAPPTSEPEPGTCECVCVNKWSHEVVSPCDDRLEGDFVCPKDLLPQCSCQTLPTDAPTASPVARVDSCCAPDGTCTEGVHGDQTFKDECEREGVHHELETCAENKCHGACCRGDEAKCRDNLSAAKCEHYEGTYMGPDSVCDDPDDPDDDGVTCGGGCCLADGTCVNIVAAVAGGDAANVTRACLTARSGLKYWGNNTACPGGHYDCGGACCCKGFGCLQAHSKDECEQGSDANAPGDFQGVGSLCDNSTAPFLNSTECAVVTTTTTTTTTTGTGTTTATTTTVPLPGACCCGGGGAEGAGECLIVDTEENCLEHPGGRWRGHGSTCEDDDICGFDHEPCLPCLTDAAKCYGVEEHEGSWDNPHHRKECKPWEECDPQYKICVAKLEEHHHTQVCAPHYGGHKTAGAWCLFETYHGYSSIGKCRVSDEEDSSDPPSVCEPVGRYRTDCDCDTEKLDTNCGEIEGHVRRSDGSGAGHVKVSLRTAEGNHDVQHVYTDAGGYYRLGPGLPAGDFVVSITLPDGYVQSGPVSLDKTLTCPVDDLLPIGENGAPYTPPAHDDDDDDHHHHYASHSSQLSSLKDCDFEIAVEGSGGGKGSGGEDDDDESHSGISGVALALIIIGALVILLCVIFSVASGGESRGRPRGRGRKAPVAASARRPSAYANTRVTQRRAPR